MALKFPILSLFLIASSFTQLSEARFGESLIEQGTEPAPLTLAKAPSHAAFSALLKQYVNASGDVNYKGLATKHDALRAYLQTLSTAVPGDSWSNNEKLAYWINLYNAATLNLILEHYPVSSIRDIAGGKPWDQKIVKVGTTMYSLNQIENDIIRPRFQEPRIHFAVNCAAASCPPLRNEAFVASKLDAQLEEQTKSFLSNTSYNKLLGTSLEVSKIFDWYGDDFGDVAKFIGKYKDVVPGATVRFQAYDWALNKQ